jgi:hypothetical protein
MPALNRPHLPPRKGIHHPVTTPAPDRTGSEISKPCCRRAHALSVQRTPVPADRGEMRKAITSLWRWLCADVPAPATERTLEAARRAALYHP